MFRFKDFSNDDGLAKVIPEGAHLASAAKSKGVAFILAM